MSDGEITFLTIQNPHACYYSDDGDLAGMEYDLAREFADYLGVSLKVRFVSEWREIAAALNHEPTVFVGANLLDISRKAQHALLSAPYLTVRRSVIVHRAGSIASLSDLSGKELHTVSGLPENASDRFTEITPSVAWVERPVSATERLAKEVAEKTIEAALIADNEALFYRRMYPAIAVAGTVGEPAAVCWAVHPMAGTLLKRMNEFLNAARITGRLMALQARHYPEIDWHDPEDLAAFHEAIENRLPHYLPLIRRFSQEHGFDWRLIAAQIYQESHFDPTARSDDGAVGLMQIVPSTGKSHAAEDLLDPEVNIAAGVRHLASLYGFFDQSGPEDRLAIALAAYNIGQGHILDARNLAVSQNLNPGAWEALSTVLPLLSQKTYYDQAIYGYCRGIEPVQYVRKIRIYRHILTHKRIGPFPLS